MSLQPYYHYRKWYKRLAAGLFDRIGTLLAGRSTPRPFDLQTIQKILVIRNDHLGDAIMTRPALKALMKRFSKAKIDLLAASESAPLFQSDGVRNILPFQHHWYSGAPWLRQVREAKEILNKLKEEHYDLGIDFRGDLRNILMMVLAGIPVRIAYGATGGKFWLSSCPVFDPECHQVELNFRLLKDLGILPPSEIRLAPFIYSEETKSSFLKKIGGDVSLNPKETRVMIHPGAGYPSKRWPFEKYENLLQRILNETSSTLFIIGTEKEKHTFPLCVQKERMHDLRGRTRLEELPILMDQMDLYLGNDSGPAHLAAAQGIPMIVLFSGTNNPGLWRPWSQKLRLVSHPVPCSPCEAKVCPLHHHQCMNEISVDQVFQEVQDLLARAGMPSSLNPRTL